MKITADTFGAELHSICLHGLEYLWQSGEAWKRYAPVLFPFICSPSGNTYRAGGREYRMKSNHGFARDAEFTMTEQTTDTLSFQLQSSSETLAQYPYPFRLTIKYCILDDGVRVEHIVRNTGNQTMYFYLGGHPAFNCPLEAGEVFTDYYVEYAQEESVARMVDGKPEIVLEHGRILPVTRALFDFDSLVLPHPHSSSIALKSRKSPHSVTVEFPQSDCITVWSPTADDRAAFVCLEPWTSVPVYFDDAEPDIEKKMHAIALAPDDVYHYAYTIRVK